MVVGIDEVSAHCSLPVVQVNLANNQLCGINLLGVGTYNADGIKAIAKAISVTPSLTYLWYKLRTQTSKRASRGWFQVV